MAAPGGPDLTPARGAGYDPLRRTTAFATALALALLAVTIVLVRGDTLPGALDVTVEVLTVTAVHQDSLSAHVLVLPGEPVPAVVLTAATLAACVALRQWRPAAVAALAPPVAVVVATAMKPVVDRLHAGHLSFPSGHSAFTGALLLAAGLLVVRRRGSRPRELVVVLLLVATVCAVVGLGLVAGRRHYATDSLGGLCVAVVVTLGLTMLLGVPRSRRCSPELPSPITGTGPALSVTPGPGRGRGRRWLGRSGARSRRRAG